MTELRNGKYRYNNYAEDNAPMRRLAICTEQVSGVGTERIAITGVIS